MNIAYATWHENLKSPILMGQVIKFLKKLARNSPKDKIYLFAFLPIYLVAQNYQDYSDLKRELFRNNVKLILIPTLEFPKIDWFKAKWPIINLILIQSFPILLLLTRIKKIDLIHCRSYPIMYSAVLVKKLLKKVKIVFDPRSPFPEENIIAGRWNLNSLSYKIWKKLEKKYLRRSDVIVAITNTYIDHFKKISKKSNFIVVPNNVDIQEFEKDNKFRYVFRSKMGIKKDEIIFTYCGSLNGYWNDPKVYAKFIIKLRDLDIKHRFLFITPNLDKLEETLKKYNISSHEYLAVSASLNKVPKYLSVGDIGINLMEKEDIRMSIKTSEYMAMGLPLLVNSKILGAKEIVEKYNVGIVIELENINLKELKQLIFKKNKLALKCRKLACKEFSTEKITEKYKRVYKSLLTQIK